MSKVFAIIYMFSLGFMPMDEVGFSNNVEKVEKATSVEFMFGVDLFDSLTVFVRKLLFKWTIRRGIKWGCF